MMEDVGSLRTVTVTSTWFHETLVETANELPPLPQSATRLAELFTDPDYSIEDLLRAVELDPTLGGRLLRMANSSNYGTSQVGAISEAIVRLGAGTVKSIAIASSVRPKRGLDLSAFGMTAESYWQHSVAAVSFSEVLASLRPGDFGTDFSTAAILHDFGKLVLAKHVSPTQVEMMQHMDPLMSCAEKEMRILRVNHAEVTAVVAQHWGLPDRLVKAVQYHHSPENCDDPLTHGLNIANQLSWRLEQRQFDLDAEADYRAHSVSVLKLTEQEMETAYVDGALRFEQTLAAYL